MSKPIDDPGVQEWFAVFRERLTQAFPVEPVPAAHELIGHDCDECRALRDDFAGRTWLDVSGEVVDAHSSDLSLFTPSAHRYYLPAYLLRAFTKESDEWGGSDVTDYAIYSLCPDQDERWQDRFGLFTTEQLQALASWLSFVLAHAHVFEPDAGVGVARFERFWQRHAT